MDERQARIENIVTLMRGIEAHGPNTTISKRAIMIVRRDFDKYSHLLDNDIIHTVMNELNGIVEEPIVEDNTPSE